MISNIVLVIKTNDNYSYLWPVIDYYVKDIKLKKIFFHNKTINNLPINFDKFIVYDDKISYMNRLLNLTNIIEEEYLILIHDVDIILNFNNVFLKKIFKIIKDNNIDYLSLNICLGNKNNLIIKDKIILANLNHIIKTNHLIPYDVSPKIWKKESLIKLTSNFKNLTYSESELNQNLQNYCKNNFKCYCLDASCVKVIYCRNLCYSNYFNFLHITTKGKFTYPVEVYMDNKDFFLEIKEKFNLNNIEIIDCNFVLKNRSYLI